MILQQQQGNQVKYSVRMRENTDQNNSEYGHFSRSENSGTQVTSPIFRILNKNIVFELFKKK